jgi:hypothetical protein
VLVDYQTIPQFYKSVQKIEVHRIEFSSQRAQIFSNFKLSHRGSIRKPPNTLTWVFALDKLQKEHGETDPSNVVSMWNSEVAKANQLLGSKASSVKNLLEFMPEDGRRELISHSNTHGWEQCAWTEDMLASKKLLPGQTPRTPNKKWNLRQTTCNESCTLMVKQINSDFEKMPLHARRKGTKTGAEEAALICALAWNVAMEAQQLMPIEDATLKSGFLDKVANSDPKVITELLLALAEKTEKFTPRDIGTLYDLMQAHQGSCCDLHCIRGVGEHFGWPRVLILLLVVAV